MKHKVISRSIAYHGTTMGALSINGIPALKETFEPLVPDVVHVRNANRYHRPADETEEQFTAFVAARRTAWLRLAWLLTGDAHQAEELVQDTLVRTYAVWGRVGHRDPYAYASCGARSRVADRAGPVRLAGRALVRRAFRRDGACAGAVL